MNILVTFDKNYILPFQTMVKSFAINHPNSQPTFWLLHKEIEPSDLDLLISFCQKQGVQLEPIQVSSSYFSKAKTTNRYPESMYYRLLAPIILPNHIERVLYIDPDTLILNNLSDLWNMELSDKQYFAAASHSMLGISNSINNLRLNTDHSYFNSGVILMDLTKARKIVDLDEMIETVNTSYNVELILPDQDLFNSLYGRYVVEIPDELYNYDTRFYQAYLLNSGNQYTMDWIMNNTRILHFCGKKKPWNTQGVSTFTSLYKYFMYL